MPGAPFSVRLRPIAAALLLALLTSTACTSEDSPTAAQAGQTLKKHVLQLLDEAGARDVAITDPGGKDIPCADGGVKQTFAVTAGDIDDDRQPQFIKDELVGALRRVARYQMISDGFDAGPVEVRDATSGSVLQLGAPAKGRIAISGWTGCLRQ
ncbi:UNVERIFIED_ORG: hypothetical protein FHR35_003602 [Microbispora rosea subsp. rosea]